MLLPNGIWISSETPRRRDGRAALFLDRDGVIVEEVDYLSRAEDVALAAGAVELLLWAKANGIPTVEITNQAGIARGYFGWPEFEAVEAEITARLAAHGVALDFVAACPFHEAHTDGFGVEHAKWRKPGGAMIELALEKLGLDARASWMIGDKASDVEAARNAGLAGAIHVLTGHGQKERAAALALARPGFEVLAAADLADVLALAQGPARLFNAPRNHPGETASE